MRPAPEQTFFVGDVLTCVDGTVTTVVSVSRDLHYESFLCDDGIHRYDRDHETDRGRVTGTRSFPPHPKTIAKFHPLKNPREVMNALASCPEINRRLVTGGGKTRYDSGRLMRQVCENLDKIFHYEKTKEVLGEEE